MTLDQKLNYISSMPKLEAAQCFTRFHELYMKKNQGALIASILTGDSEKYIAQEYNTYVRYVKRWQYHHDKNK